MKLHCVTYKSYSGIHLFIEVYTKPYTIKVGELAHLSNSVYKCIGRKAEKGKQMTYTFKYERDLNKDDLTLIKCRCKKWLVHYV